MLGTALLLLVALLAVSVLVAAFQFHRSHAHAIDSAGRDGCEASQRTTNIEPKSMERHPLANTHPDGGKFAFSDPNARQAVPAASVDAQFLAVANDGFLKASQIEVQILNVILQINDRVTD